MFDESSKISDVEVINVLRQALQSLTRHRFQENLQLDFDHYFQIEEQLKQVLTQLS